MSTCYILTRTITPEECPWLDATFEEATLVYDFTRPTYSVVGPYGRAVSRVPDEYPFFELPCDAMMEVQ